MKLAHLIIAHHNPQMLERLVKRLRHTDADIYIQLDKKTDIVGFKYIEEKGYASFIINRVNITPGGYGFIKATLNGLKEILQVRENYSHINLLSSQDYPLKPISDIHEFLFSYPDKTFVHAYEVPQQWPEGLQRLDDYSLHNFDLPWRQRLEQVINTVLPKRKMPYGLKPYGRSQWFTITPLCAQYVVNYAANNPEIRQFFKYTKGGDELFFQTILLNSGLRNTIINNNLRYTELDSADEPAILRIDDIEKLLRSGKFFARKFDAGISNSALNYLDDVVTGQKRNLA